MTLAEFQNHMGRLIEQFGKSAYSQPRTEILWREVKDMSCRWWETTVDQLLGDCRQAPLMPEFREAVAKERERLWQIEKKKHAQEAREFFHSSYQPDDVRTICQTILKRLTTGISDSDYEQFTRMLTNVAAGNPKAKIQCQNCEDSGLCFTNEYVFRCRCTAGMQKPKAYPLYQQ